MHADDETGLSARRRELLWLIQSELMIEFLMAGGLLYATIGTDLGFHRFMRNVGILCMNNRCHCKVIVFFVQVILRDTTRIFFVCNG